MGVGAREGREGGECTSPFLSALQKTLVNGLSLKKGLQRHYALHNLLPPGQPGEKIKGVGKEAGKYLHSASL